LIQSNRIQMLFIIFSALFTTVTGFGEDRSNTHNKDKPSSAGKQIASFDFESSADNSYSLNSNAQITTDPAMVIAGNHSLRWNGWEAPKEWNEFLHSNNAKFPLKANSSYTVSFKYKIINKRTVKSQLYFLVRSASGGHDADTGWTEINDEVGISGEKSITFTLGNFADYSLIIGGHYQCEVVIDNLMLFEINQENTAINTSTPIIIPKSEQYLIERAQSIAIDGDGTDFGSIDNLHEWHAPKYLYLNTSQRIFSKNEWKGDEDLSGRVTLQKDDSYLYIFAEIIDDAPMNQTNKSQWENDYIELFLSTCPHQGDTNQYVSGDYQLQLLPGNDNTKPSVFLLKTTDNNKKLQTQVLDFEIISKKKAVNIDDKSSIGYVVEAKISLKNFPELAPESPYIIFNIAVGDRDDAIFKKCFVGGTDQSHISTEGFLYGFIYKKIPVYLDHHFDIGNGAENCLIPDNILPERMTGQKVRIWDMKLAAKKKYEARESICLDGIWAEQTFSEKPGCLDDNAWKYILVPISSKGFREDWLHPYFENKDGMLSCISGIQSYKLFPKQYYRALFRTFSLPLSWKGQSVFLQADNRGIVVSLSVYINKTLVSGKSDDGCSCVDISKYIQWGKPNTITILANSTALRKSSNEYPLSLGDIWLHKGSKQNFISSAFINSDVPNNSIEFNLSLENELHPDLKIDILVYDNQSGEIAAEWLQNNVDSFTIDKNSVKLKTIWNGYKPWSPEHPNLYTAHIKLTAATGEILDDVKQRFGMHTTRINGKYILLNNHPVHLRGVHINSRTQTYSYYKHMKEIGLNTYFIFGTNIPEYILNWFDELGIFIIPHAGGAHVGHAFGQVDTSIERRRWIEKVRNHPCILMYLGNITPSGKESGWIHWNFSKTGTSYFPQENKANLLMRGENLSTIDFLQSADPTRPVFHYCAGNQEPVWSIMNHADFGMPIQECAAGAESWAKTENPKPFIMAESWPMPTGVNIDLERGESAHIYSPLRYKDRKNADNCLVIEELSQYIGEKAYVYSEPVRTFSLPNVHISIMSKMWDRKNEDIWTPSKKWMYCHKNPAEIALTSIALREHARSDRGYGLSGRNYFTDVFPFSCYTQADSLAVTQMNNTDSFYTPLSETDNIQKRKIWRQYRTSNLFGMASDTAALNDINKIIPEKNEYDNYFNDAFNPFLIYIGGGPKPEQFRYKDHNYFSHEKIIKHIVLINDSETQIDCKVNWGIRQTGKVLFEKQFEICIPSCVPLKKAIEFEPPASMIRQEYEIFISTNVNNKLHEDTFTITVFPPTKITGNLTIYLYDSHGDTQDICQRIGINATPFQSFDATEKNSVLVIGRNSLNSLLECHSTAALQQKIKDGLRVLVMEQAAGSLWYPLQKEIRVRHQFIKDRYHPILIGLSDKDFSHWRGQATLTESHPQWDLATEYSDFTLPQMFGHWGAEGIVSTLPMIRPQHGNARTLLSGGFDQEWSALMEYDYQKGTVIVSQLDMCGRSADDPVVHTLFANMIHYLIDKKENHYLPLAYIPEQNLNQLLDRFKPATTENLSDTQVLVVSASQENLSQKHEWLDVQVRNQGKTMLVLLAEPSDDLGWLSQDIQIMREGEHNNCYYKHIITDEEKNMAFLDGINSDDLYFKFRREEIPLITKVPKNGEIFFSGLGAFLRMGKGNVIILQLNPERHKEERSYKKVIRVFSRLFTNLNIGLNYELNFGNNDLEMSSRMWKFCIDPQNRGDKERWFSAEYDDSAWRDIHVGKSWESQGVTDTNPLENASFGTSYNGVGWYRIQFDVPSYIKGKQLYLEIAAVAGEDTIYVNGNVIGKTDKTSSGDSRNLTKMFRNYPIPTALLHPNGNTLAIKVYNNTGMGGLSKLPVRIMTHDCPNETALYPIEKSKKTGDPYRFIMW